ncbi:PAS domain-containing protein [Sphingomonas sp. NBWT7]|uniref:PAS domain-containing sensor histidine kinase n=1 Tax=Sphingomonas sp. NBWT7 TaxID=2596913 RepID=UPI00162927B0|nr:ATP-binding protein [Sphingomonas sp. NBWT7]QNE31080.1 PAS domain-containing protein [Sphingomonas sp. NBWT7]
MSFLAFGIALILAALCGAILAHRLGATGRTRAREGSEDNIRHVADSVPQVLWQGLPDGRVTFMNLRWTEITGATVEEGLDEDGWAWKNWFHPEDRQGLLDDWAQARATGRQFDSYRRLLHADGTYRWLQITARPVRSEEGAILRWYGVSTDIHAEMQAQLSVRALNQTLEQRVEERTRDLSVSEQRYRSIFERSQVALFEQNLDELVEALSSLHALHGDLLAGYLRDNPDKLSELLQLLRTEEVNSAALQFLGKSRSSLLRHSRPGVVDPKPFAELLQLIAEGRQDHWEGIVTLMVADGSIRQALCGITLVRGLGSTRAFTHLSDITEREHTREMLMEAREELSRANRALTVGALSMSLAHDLGQPISSIAMDATVGRRSLARTPSDTATASKALDRVISSARRAAELLNRVRETSSRRERSVEPVGLAEIIRVSVGLLEHEVRLQGCSVHLNLPAGAALVAADRVELQQVLINLILNALAASQCSSLNDRTIEVRLTEGADEVVVEVKDGGVGLPAGEESRIFDPLFSTRAGGMGMGLAICRTIIQGFGGDLTARNNPHGGATFEFTLPRSR